MDNRYYDNVIAEMKSFLDEKEFKPFDDGFANENKKVVIEYNEEKQTYSLLVADKNDDGEFGDLRLINSWLFDDSQTAKDAGSVGIDFTVSLRKELGVKLSRPNANVELPTANKSGCMTIAGFTKKMLDVFPALKEDYKNHIAIYGNFLYINFFGEFLVPQLKNIFTNGTKKQIKKLYDVFEDAYVGDNETVNIMIAVLCAAAYNDEKCKSAIEDMLSADNHFLQSFRNFYVKLPKSKKLFEALVK